MTSAIHPTALIHPSASIGEGCIIGPYSVIGPEVRLGAANVLHSHSVLDGRASIGAANEFHPFSRVGGPPQLAEGTRAGSLIIGSKNIFREGTTVQPSTNPEGTTKIGSRCRFLAGSHVGHDCQIGDDVIISNSVAIAGHVQIGDQAYVSGLVGIHQWVSVGRLSFIAAGSMVDRSILPFCLTQGDRAKIRGFNRVGIIRSGASEKFISDLKIAVRSYIFGHLSLSHLLEADAAEESILGEWARFARATRRGLAPPSRPYR